MPSALATAVPGAAPAWVADRVNGPRHTGWIVHSGPDALYFTSGEDVLGVTSRHAVAVPCAISTRLASLALLPLRARTDIPQVGDRVQIGDGVVDLGSARVKVARITVSVVPRLERSQSALMLSRLAALGGRVETTELDAEALDRLAAADPSALAGVLGRGSGLTPYSDDVVCGLVATLRAAADPCVAKLCPAIAEIAPRATTGLSATLLRRACAGDMLPVFAYALTDLDPRTERTRDSIARLLTVGHTSGAGMLLGLALALDHIANRRCP